MNPQLRHIEILRRLLPPVAYDVNGPVLLEELGATAAVLDDLVDFVAIVLRETSPVSSEQLLSDYERVFGLPDQCRPQLPASLIERRANVRQKMVARGGQSRDYFQSMLDALGLDARILEFSPHTVNHDVDAHIYSLPWIFAWEIVVNRAGSTVSPEAVALECQIKRLKPAHTVVLFTYS